jgi:hypothetical protein
MPFLLEELGQLSGGLGGILGRVDRINLSFLNHRLLFLLSQIFKHHLCELEFLTPGKPPNRRDDFRD